MKVPFLCQHDIECSVRAGRPPVDPAWAPRSCAIACATMVLQAYGRRVTMEDVLDASLARGGWDGTRGWRHGVLVDVLQSFGLLALRRNWRLLDGHETDYLGGRAMTRAVAREIDEVKRQMLAEGVWTLSELVGSGVPVIISVYRPYGDRRSVGHQVVLLPVPVLDELAFHDPAERDGRVRQMSLHELVENWKGTAIIVVGELTQNHPQ